MLFRSAWLNSRVPTTAYEQWASSNNLIKEKQYAEESARLPGGIRRQHHGQGEQARPTLRIEQRHGQPHHQVTAAGGHRTLNSEGARRAG